MNRFDWLLKKHLTVIPGHLVLDTGLLSACFWPSAPSNLDVVSLNHSMQTEIEQYLNITGFNRKKSPKAYMNRGQ